LKLYLAEMARLGVTRIVNIVCDRGSEFFEQSGDTMFDKDRCLHAFHRVCEDFRPARINLMVQPIESKAKRAELFFREHFKVADAYLWEARLGPWALADALSYSAHQFNRIPQDRLGGLSPWTVVTGERARWDNFRVFGADVYEFIPNDKFAKIPGVPKGRKVIFVGFDVGASGFRVFDPESRRYYSTKNAYFYEDFSHRVDALRHHDRRRALLKKGKQGVVVDLPLVLDDFDDTDSSAVRNLYLDPDSPPPSLDTEDEANDLLMPLASQGGASQSSEKLMGAKDGGSLASTADSSQRGTADCRGAEEPSMPSQIRNGASGGSYDEPFPRTPLAPKKVLAERIKQAVQQHVPLRPLRLTSVGQPQKLSEDDRAFIRHAERVNLPIVYQSPNPKRLSSSSRAMYQKYMRATTLCGALELGAKMKDVFWDYERGYISFPTSEPDLPGHVFEAQQLARQHNYTHVLEDCGCFIAPKHAEPVLAKAFGVQHHRTFHQLLETVYEPEVIVEQLRSRESMLRLAEQSFSKVLNSTTATIDWSLSPEPTRFEDVQPEVCG